MSTKAKRLPTSSQSIVISQKQPPATLDAALASPSTAIVEIDVVRDTVVGFVGTTVPDDAPLMSAGLDSIAATELVSTLGQSFSTEIEPTTLFDYPTIESLGKYFAG